MPDHVTVKSPFTAGFGSVTDEPTLLSLVVVVCEPMCTTNVYGLWDWKPVVCNVTVEFVQVADGTVCP